MQTATQYLLVVTLIAALIAGAAIFARLRRLRAVWHRPANAPEAFLRRGRGPSTTRVIVCVGDSITHGIAGADYVATLRHRFGPAGYEFVNAGINGNLSYNVVRRLNEIIACRPDIITILIGTNDVNATFDPEWEAYYRDMQGLPEQPTPEAYRQNMAQIIDRLQTETDAQLVILDLPPLGEDLSSEMNRRVGVYNAALREIAAARGVACLLLHERLTRLLPPGHTPPPYEGDRSLMARAIVSRYLWQKQWDDIAAANGLSLLTDHIHLNEKAAAVVADLISDYLHTTLQPDKTTHASTTLSRT